jgi:sigma-B regulation protein RsbU (phosphoserine phosphatase)
MWSPSRSLIWRLSIFILGGAGLILAAVMFVSNAAQSRLLVDQQHEQGDVITQAAVNRINELLGHVQTLTQATAVTLKSSEENRLSAWKWAHEFLDNNKDISGISIAFSPDYAARPYDVLHIYRKGDEVLVEKSNNGASERMNDWYYLPQYLRKAVWVEPYYDAQSGGTAVMYAVPIVADGGRFIGVAACELSLQDIRDMLDALPLGESGMAFLLSRQGVYISHPVRSYEMTQSMYSVGESFGAPGKPIASLDELSSKLLSGEPGFIRYSRSSDDEPSYIFYRPVALTGWSLYVTIPEAQILAPLKKQNETDLIVGLAGGFLLLIAAIWVAFSIVKPLHLLASAAGRLATGDFDAPLPATHRGDEIGRLTTSFGKMREDLHSYIDELTTTTAAKEKIASELTIAHEIQLGIVPKLFPPFPERRDLDLFAALEPAKEVGGDLYDFTLLDEDHLYVAIGDVSGKGVPASLLMAVGKTLLKSTIQAVRDPGRALGMVNDELATDNDSCMFITAFCGILNLHSGHFTFANAGHNPPLIVTKDGSAKYLSRKPGPALGALEHIRFENMDVKLADEEVLLLYTDGVTEAMNPKNEMFGEDRLRDLAATFKSSSAEKIVKCVVENVHSHASGADQSDDITVLAVRSMAKVARETAAVPNRAPDAAITLKSHKEELEKLVAWLEGESEKRGIAPAVTMSLNLALEEWFVNIVSYAYTDKDEHDIPFRFWKEGNSLILQIEDDGQPFDPTAQAEPDTTQSIEQRKIGGLGIHFIRKTVNLMGYSRENNKNVLTLVKRLDAETKL